MGAKVLHPRCIGPCQWAGIPLEIKNTWDPHVQGTRIVQATPETPESDQKYRSAVMAVVRRLNVTLVSLSSLDMWGTSGFLAKAFAHFEALGNFPVFASKQTLMNNRYFN